MSREKKGKVGRTASQQTWDPNTNLPSVLLPWWLILETEEGETRVCPPSSPAGLYWQGTRVDTGPGHFSPACFLWSPQ